MTNPTKIADNLLSELRRDFEMDDATEDLVRDAVWLAWGKGQDALRAADADEESSEPGGRARALEEAAHVAEVQAHLYGPDDPRWPGAAKAAIDIAESIRAIARNSPTEHTP